MDDQLQARLGARRPTARQIYALAAALCERLGEEFPTSSAAASELIERLRRENGHPAPALEDSPVRRRRGKAAVHERDDGTRELRVQLGPRRYTC